MVIYTKFRDELMSKKLYATPNELVKKKFKYGYINKK